MAEAQAEEAPGTVARWRILFITDLHGLLDGYRVGVRERHGGVGLISDIVRNERLYAQGDLRPEESFDRVMVCLGGDIVRRFTDRLLHEDSAARIWDKLLELVRPDAVVFGNHELADFGNTFVAHVARSTGNTGYRCGCTRNVEWEDVSARTGDGVKCGTSPEVWVPCCSIHRHEHGEEGDEPRFLFIGLVDWSKRDEERLVKLGAGVHSPYRVRVTVETTANVLVPYCLSEVHGPSQNRIIVLLAHYGGTEELLTVKPGVQPGEAFGLLWRQGHSGLSGSKVEPEDWRTPHFILKGHDHSCSRDRPHGLIHMNRRHWEKISGTGATAREWIPTFSGGSDGEGIGFLDIELRNDGGLGYKWTYKRTDAPALDWEVPHPIQLASKNDWVWKGAEFEIFGRDESDPSLLAYSMDLLLQSLLHACPEGESAPLAIASPPSILPHSEVPEYLAPHWNVSTRDIQHLVTPRIQALIDAGERGHVVVQRAWNQKIDMFDLRSVYGSEEWKAFLGRLPVTRLKEAVRDAFDHPKAAYTLASLPLTGEPDDILMEDVPQDQFPKADSLWVTGGNRLFVLARRPRGGDSGHKVPIHLYEVHFKPAGQGAEKRCSLLNISRTSAEAAEDLLCQVLNLSGDIVVCTTEFAANKQLICGNSGIDVPASRRPIYRLVQEYLDICGLPEVLRR